MKKTKYVLDVMKDGKIILVHLITFDIMVYELKLMKAWVENRVAELPTALSADLYNKHYLVENEEEDQVLLEKAQALFSKRRLSVPTIVIYLSDECNLRCSYCYSGYQFANHNSITKRDVDIIFDSIKVIYQKNEYLQEKPLISIFGGEPLMPKNMEILNYIINKMNEDGYEDLEIVTNLTNVRLFSDIIKGFNSQVSLKVTLNGNKSIHDKIRKFINGRGTYDIIINNINYVLQNMKNTVVDLSILIDNSISLEGIEELFEDLQKNHFLDNPQFTAKFGHIQFRSNYICDGYEGRIIPVENYYPMLFKMKKQIHGLSEEMISGSSMYMLKRLYNHLRGKDVITPSFVGCDAVYPGRYCFYTDGKIYPCYDCVGMSGFSIGEFREGLKFYDFFEKIKNFSVLDLDKCNKCKYVAVCNGGCIISSVSKNKCISDVYCERIEESFRNFIDFLYTEGIISGV